MWSQKTSRIYRNDSIFNEIQCYVELFSLIRTNENVVVLIDPDDELECENFLRISIERYPN